MTINFFSIHITQKIECIVLDDGMRFYLLYRNDKTANGAKHRYLGKLVTCLYCMFYTHGKKQICYSHTR